MDAKVENKVANNFDADLKLIEEWIQKPIEQIEVSLKVASRIKELNDVMNINFECANYKKKKKTTVLSFFSLFVFFVNVYFSFFFKGL